MSDGYVGIVKGVILSINPNVTLVDISHDIRSWEIEAAAWVIWNAQRFFAPGAIHLCVVDPAVGSKTQRGVAIANDNATFVGPDNGIFSHMIRQQANWKCYELTNRQYWRDDISTTFHTRDIYGPVCAHLAKGVPLSALGPEIEPGSIKQTAPPQFNRSGNALNGCIVYVDKFGNLISNVPGNAVEKGQSCYLDGRLVGVVSETYASAQKGRTAVFIGSHGFVEIGAYQASAQSIFGAATGAIVRLEPK